jgi:hypothetical protein
MAKDDPGGLLSKVVRFVRNPATNWSDLDEPESVGDSGNSRQMLKELVERKKRNDVVRKREFEMLRKLRRREMAGSQASAPRPSFFQSSLPSKPDERAQTLKKIDEIEAQMSMQWWKTKHRDTSINSSICPTSGPSQSAPQRRCACRWSLLSGGQQVLRRRRQELDRSLRAVKPLRRQPAACGRQCLRPAVRRPAADFPIPSPPPSRWENAH